MKTEDIFTLMDVAEFAQYLERFRFTRPVRRIQNHHTWKPDYSHFNGSNHFDRLRSMRHSHVVERGWSEIGQNITTFPDGLIAICRPLDQVPACIKGANTAAIGIEHIGNFDAGHDTEHPSHPVHRLSIIAVNALLCRKLSLVPGTDTVVYHHWYDLNTGARTNGTGSTKSCPGTAFFGGNTVEDCERIFIPAIRSWSPATTTMTHTPVAAVPKGVVITERLNVRSRPTVTSTILAVLRRGDQVSMYERATAADGSAWVLVDRAANHWVAQRFISELQQHA